jgi:hypothetical protein
MRGLMKNKFSGVYPALLIALVSAPILLSGWFLLRRFQIEVEITPPENQNSVPIIQTNPSAQGSSPQPNASTSQPDKPAKPDPALVAAQKGSLRVSNRSSHALRVAMLSRQEDGRVNAGGAEAKSALPAHWDFAPNEGGDQGLIVSLPNQTTRLKPGDVVVAFAQDGSQRYWGPFVLGETDRPRWNSKTGEWELILDE